MNRRASTVSQTSGAPGADEGEVISLRRTIRDLAALSALPCIWVDCDLPRSLKNLADVLRAALQAYTVCVRVEIAGGECIEAGASRGLSVNDEDRCHAAELLDLLPGESTQLLHIPKFNGSGPLQALSRGIYAEGRPAGMIAAFYSDKLEPGPNDALLLDVAVNQVRFLLQRHKDQAERAARQAAEERLHETEHHYRQLMQSVPAAVYTCDQQGTITMYNEAAAALWGRRPKIGEDKWCGSWKIFRPDGSPMPLDECPMAVAIREERAVRGQEIIVERPDGTRAWVLPHPEPIRDTSGRVAGTVNMLVQVDELKRAQQELESSQARLQSLLTLMPAAVYACDAEGRFTFFNRRAAEIWGQEPRLNDEGYKYCAMYKCYFAGRFIPPGETPMAVAVREGKSFRNLEPEVECPDGRRLHMLVNIDAVVDGEGKSLGAINVFQDITPLKQAERELSRKNGQLAAFLETAAMGLHRVGPDGVIQWANAAEMRMLGYSPEEYIGHHIREFHADEPVICDILDRLNSGEKLVEYEARLRCKDGTLKHVLIDSSVLWEDGKFIHTQCFTRDITERKKAQESVSRLAAIVEHSDDAIFSINLDGVINSWNQGAERLYGYREAEAIGQALTMLVPEELRAREARILNRMRQGDAVENYETERVRKDGTVIAISLTASPIKDAKDHVIGISKVARDITQKIRAREMLEKTVAERTAQLREIVAELEAFSYSVAHDMRAPLRSMTTYSRLLEEDYGQALPPEARHFANRINVGAARLDSLITDVLNYSRIARSEMPLDKVDIEKLAREIVETYPDLREAGRVSIESPLPAVTGNAAALTQCISNLLSNAMKFVAPGVAPRVVIRAEPGPEYVRLWFEDNGIGISAEGQKRIFRMFQRLHPASQFEGTGIGLTIVRKAVERMGGRVGVESQPGQGSRFWIDLKRAL